MERRQKEASKTLLGLFFYVPMLVAALAINSLAGTGSLFFSIPPLAAGKWQLLTAAVLAGAIVMVGPFLSRQFAWARKLEVEFKHTLGTMSGVEILVLAVLSSVCEEALFRGALQPLFERGAVWLLDSGPSARVVWGVVLSSVVFAAAHPPLRPELRPWTVFAFVLGLMLGALFAWEPRNLLGPILVHFLINFVNLHRINRLDVTPRAEPEASPPPDPVATAATED